MKLNKEVIEMLSILKERSKTKMSDNFVIERALYAMLVSTRMSAEDQTTLTNLFKKYTE